MACAISTKDNPYNPITQFDLWLKYDLEKGYNSCSYLSRIALTSDQMSSSEEAEEIERAIDEIIQFDPFDMYVKVTEPDEDT